MKFQMNKTKLIARVLVLVLLVTSAFNFVGCGIGYKYYRVREKYSFHTMQGAFRVRSKVDTFDINDLTLELAIGIHKVSLFGKMDEFPKRQYSYGSEDKTFALYICEGDFERKFPSTVVLDIKNVGNHLFIKEITQDEAFSKEYGYNIFKCNHKENITIPSEYLIDDVGDFVIKLVVYSIDDVGGYTFYYYSLTFNIVLEYEKIDDNTIRITNFYERW